MKENFNCRTMDTSILLYDFVYIERSRQGEVSKRERTIYIEHSEL